MTITRTKTDELIRVLEVLEDWGAVPIAIVADLTEIDEVAVKRYLRLLADGGDRLAFFEHEGLEYVRLVKRVTPLPSDAILRRRESIN